MPRQSELSSLALCERVTTPHQIANQECLCSRCLARLVLEQISKLECDLAHRTVELQTKDEAIAQIDIDVREMQSIIESLEKENDVLKSECDGLRRDHEHLRILQETNN